VPGPLSSRTRRLILWEGIDEWRAEAVTMELAADGIHARGTQLGGDPLPYRLDYRLAAPAFITEGLEVDVAGDGWGRSLRLTRDARGEWTIDAQGEGDPALGPPGGDARALRGAIDCDLGLSPLTNLLPIRRDRLHEAAARADYVMAWVSVPDLGVIAYPQRYEHVRRDPGGSVVRFTSLGVDEGFQADLELDPDGLVVVYPQLARRVMS
jgi:uncharacterized protein